MFLCLPLVCVCVSVSGLLLMASCTKTKKQSRPQAKHPRRPKKSTQMSNSQTSEHPAQAPIKLRSQQQHIQQTSTANHISHQKTSAPQPIKPPSNATSNDEGDQRQTSVKTAIPEAPIPDQVPLKTARQDTGDTDNTEPKQNRTTRTKSRRLRVTAFSKTENPENVLKEKQVLWGRWQILGKIGDGGYGSVFAAHDLLTKQQVAVKAMRADPSIERDVINEARMHLEIDVLRSMNDALRGGHAPEIYGAGQEKTDETNTPDKYDPLKHPHINYFVMQMLARTLSDLRQASPEDRLSFGTGVRCFKQAVIGLAELHARGFIHRDIKPSNMGVGSKQFRVVFLLDFGLARRYVNSQGKPRFQRKYGVGFRGSARYASQHALNRKDQSRGDDLVALMYSLIELTSRSSLPWSHVEDHKRMAKMKALYYTEKAKYNELMCMLPGVPMQKLDKYIHALSFYDTPDYDQMLQLCNQALSEADVKEEDPYDWEDNYEQVLNAKPQTTHK